MKFQATTAAMRWYQWQRHKPHDYLFIWSLQFFTKLVFPDPTSFCRLDFHLAMYVSRLTSIIFSIVQTRIWSDSMIWHIGSCKHLYCTGLFSSIFAPYYFLWNFEWFINRYDLIILLASVTNDNFNVVHQLILFCSEFSFIVIDYGLEIQFHLIYQRSLSNRNKF